ncbi:MAG: hypothetical protein IKV82_05575 [Akkermansia sp.]|nr:hypothetical protein [Akkermansia sp.]
MTTQELPKDIFKRKVVAQRMCKIIAELEPSTISPLALDGSWGSGKTIHAQRLKEEFELKYNDTIKCIYWNASESDFSENPILALVASLYQQIPENEKRKEFAKRALALFSGFLIGGSSFLANQYINYQTGGVWNSILSSKFWQKARDCAKWFHSKAKKQEENFERVLKVFSEEEERIKAAKELVNIVREDKDLVYIIDELDRCRPNFALKMLESIKHLFSVDKCKFILVMNKDSVASSIEKMYGLKGEASESYLDKYIKMTFQLPSIFQLEYATKSKCAKTYFMHLIGEGDWNNILVRDFLDFLIDEKSISLREVEKMVSTIVFMDKVSNGKLDKTGDFNTFFICYLAYLFALNHNLAIEIASKKTDTNFVLDDIGWHQDELKYPGHTMPKYVECLKPILDIYFSDEEDKDTLIATYPKNRHGQELGRRSLLFEQWMGYSAFML